MHVSKQVEENFRQRLSVCKELIARYNIEYQQAGIFGSYARGEFKSTSDIDICIVTDKRPDRATSGSLREETDIIGVDIIYVTPEYFSKDTTLFANNLRKMLCIQPKM